MILFSFLIAVLGVTYWASIADPKFRRSHSTAFVVLLMLVGAERYRAERICQTPEVLADDIKEQHDKQADSVEALSTRLAKAFERGQTQWYAKSNKRRETQPTTN